MRTFDALHDALSQHTRPFRQMRLLMALVVLLAGTSCSDPNSGQERFETEDGRTAIGVARVVERTADSATVSDVTRGQRRYLSICGSPDSLALATNPIELTASVSSATPASADCAPFLTLIWDVRAMTPAADAVRIEIVDNGRLGWIRSDRLGYAVDPGECLALYSNDPSRQDRCRIGPPVWPSSDSTSP